MSPRKKTLTGRGTKPTKETSRRSARKPSKASRKAAPRRTSRKPVRRATRTEAKPLSSRKVGKTVRAVRRAATAVIRRGARVTRTSTSSPLVKLLDAQRVRLRPSGKPEPAVERFVRDLDEAIPPAEILLGGSYAKGTHLKGKFDIDVFVRFPRGTPDSVMSGWIARALPKAEPLQGSRTYFQVKRGRFLFEVVPVCAITAADQLLNVTDMSPLHVAHVRGALSEAQKDDVRLAKQFCKAAGVYGAESYVKGFSGYVLELLIAHYGSFEALLRAAAGPGFGDGKDAWPHAHGSKLVLDPAKHYRDGHAALLHLNESKTQAPIVLIDPVDKTRNAAAAVSVATYERFRVAAQAFLDDPSSVFFDTALALPRIKQAWRGKKVLVVTVATPAERQDIAGCKVLASHESAVRVLTENGFPLVHAEWRFGERLSTCWYVLDSLTMPALTEQRGPPARPEMAGAIAAFREKHPKAVMKADETGKQRWFAPVPRAYTAARDGIMAAWNGWKPRFRVL